MLAKQRDGWVEFVPAVKLITANSMPDFKGEIRKRLAELGLLRCAKRKSLRSFRSI